MEEEKNQYVQPTEDLVIIELDQRLEFGIAALDSDLTADDNNGCANGSFCSGNNPGCSNGDNCS